MKKFLNVGKIIARSNSNGPGKRSVIWVQGCDQKCSGCRNQNFWNPVNGQAYDIEELADQIMQISDIQGVTFSGGEPFDQAEALADLSILLKEENLSIVSYSGYTLDQLKNKKDTNIDKLLSQIDILIDGPYVESKSSNLLWRGSSNQKVHFLTDKYRHLERNIDKPETRIGVSFDQDEFSVDGNIDDYLMQKLTEGLKSYGIILK